jgi:hypothetical protein
MYNLWTELMYICSKLQQKDSMLTVTGKGDGIRWIAKHC